MKMYLLALLLVLTLAVSTTEAKFGFKGFPRVVNNIVDNIKRNEGTVQQVMRKGSNSIVKPLAKSTLVVGSLVKEHADRFPSLVNDMVDTMKKQAGTAQHYIKKGSNLVNKNVPVIGKAVTDLTDDIDFHKSCKCQNLSCWCSVHIEMDSLGMDETACLNMTYLTQNVGVRAVFSLNGKIWADEEISVRNPPPICIDIPHMKMYASLCLRLKDVEYGPRSFSACSDIEIEVLHVSLKKFELGCFHLP